MCIPCKLDGAGEHNSKLARQGNGGESGPGKALYREEIGSFTVSRRRARSTRSAPHRMSRIGHTRCPVDSLADRAIRLGPGRKYRRFPCCSWPIALPPRCNAVRSIQLRGNGAAHPTARNSASSRRRRACIRAWSAPHALPQPRAECTPVLPMQRQGCSTPGAFKRRFRSTPVRAIRAAVRCPARARRNP